MTGGNEVRVELWKKAELLLLDRLCPRCEGGEIIDAIRICDQSAYRLEVEEGDKWWAEHHDD